MTLFMHQQLNYFNLLLVRKIIKKPTLFPHAGKLFLLISTIYGGKESNK